MAKTAETLRTRQQPKRTTAPLPPAHHAKCPACEHEGTLFVTADGMVLCTHCFWATETQPAR